jgi:hypothetical protein
MKKFMFSAIAMIAFVGTSMANGIAEKDSTSVVDPLTKEQCDSAYKASILYYRNHGATKEQAEAYSKAGRDACYKDNCIVVQSVD